MKYLASLDFDLRQTYKIRSTSNEPTFWEKSTFSGSIGSQKAAEIAIFVR